MSSSIATALTFFSISVLVLSVCLLQASVQQTTSDVSETESVKKEEDDDRQIGAKSGSLMRSKIIKHIAESETEKPPKSLTASLRQRRSVSITFFSKHCLFDALFQYRNLRTRAQQLIRLQSQIPNAGTDGVHLRLR